MSDETPDSTSRRTITLTNAAPVIIREEDWPVIAFNKWHEGKLEFQAFRKGWIYVRRHATDGRVLVYGGMDSRWSDELPRRGGKLLEPDAWGAVKTERIVDAIMCVVRDTLGSEVFARSVVAKLPAVEI